MTSPRTALLAVGAALCLLPVAPAAAGARPITAPTSPPPAAGAPVVGALAAGLPAARLAPSLGPRVRVRRTVAAGAPVLLPRVAGRVRIVCHGPVMRGAAVWLERQRDGRTAVRRYDGGRAYDFTYRVVVGEVRAVRERCP